MGEPGGLPSMGSHKVGHDSSDLAARVEIMASGSIISWQIDGETMETVRDFIFLGSRITADDDCTVKLKDNAPWKKSYDKPRQHIKKQRHYFADKGPSSQSYGFSSSYVRM